MGIDLLLATGVSVVWVNFCYDKSTLVLGLLITIGFRLVFSWVIHMVKPIGIGGVQSERLSKQENHVIIHHPDAEIG